MAKILSEIEIELLPIMESITESNFLNYFFWQRSSGLVKDTIVSKFEESLLNKTGFNEQKIPYYTKETTIEISDDLEFIISTSPTSKKISQSSVLGELSYMVNFLKEQYDQGLRPQGILTIDNKSYLDLDLILNKYDELISFKETRNGINNIISSIPSLEEVDLADIIKISISRNYSSISELNGLMYLTAKKFIKEGDSRAKAFKELLREESLKFMGVTNSDNLSEVSLVGYEFNNYKLICQLEPRSTTKYVEVLNALFKSEPKQIRSNSKIGDLEKVKIIIQNGSNYLRDKGLIDDSFLETYKPLVRDDKIYVKLNGVVLKFKEYQELYTTKGIELNLGVMPS